MLVCLLIPRRCISLFYLRFASGSLFRARGLMVATRLVRSTIRVLSIHVHGGCLSRAISHRRFSGLFRTQNVRFVGGVIWRRWEGHSAHAFRGVRLYRLWHGRVYFVLPLQALLFGEGLARRRVRFVLVGATREGSRGLVPLPTLLRRVRREDVPHVEFVERSRQLLVLEGGKVRQLRGEGRLFSGHFPLPRRRFPDLHRRLLPGRGRLLLSQGLAFRRHVALYRHFVVSCRHVRVFFVVLEGRRVRGATTFLAPPYGRFKVNKQGRSRERRASVIQGAAMLFLVSLRLLFQATLRPTVGLLKDSILYFVGTLGSGRILFVAGVLEVGQVTKAFTRERRVRHVRRIHFPRTILTRGAVRFNKGVGLRLFRVLVVWCKCPFRCRYMRLGLFAGMTEFS